MRSSVRATRPAEMSGQPRRRQGPARRPPAHRLGGVKKQTGSGRLAGLLAVEILAAVGAASGLGALLLEGVAPATSLTVIYLLAVLFVAIRRGEVPGLV